MNDKAELAKITNLERHARQSESYVEMEAVRNRYQKFLDQRSNQHASEFTREAMERMRNIDGMLAMWADGIF